MPGLVCGTRTAHVDVVREEQLVHCRHELGCRQLDPALFGVGDDGQVVAVVEGCGEEAMNGCFVLQECLNEHGLLSGQVGVEVPAVIHEVFGGEQRVVPIQPDDVGGGRWFRYGGGAGGAEVLGVGSGGGGVGRGELGEGGLYEFGHSEEELTE